MKYTSGSFNVPGSRSSLRFYPVEYAGARDYVF
jgi:hypothetical protein